jgi:Flp pilus assembly secretin CpaC
MRIDLGACVRSLVVAAFAWAVSTGVAAAANETVDVAIDFAKVMRLDKPAHTIIIGNPGIADASIDDETTLILTGKTAGTTNLIVLDEDGTETLNTTIRVSSDIHQLTTVFYGRERQTFSCSPVCEQVISVGDDPSKFESATTQIQTRQQVLSGQ